jgi:hypothetical protein
MVGWALPLTPHQMHAYEMHAYEMHAREVYAHEAHAHETHAYQTHAHQILLGRTYVFAAFGGPSLVLILALHKCQLGHSAHRTALLAPVTAVH